MSDQAAARRLLAAALGVEPTALDARAAIGTVPEWDSLAHVRLMTEIERTLGRPLTPEEIVSVVSLDTLAALLPRA